MRQPAADSPAARPAASARARTTPIFTGTSQLLRARHRGIVMKHCPASCGLCEDREYLERHLELANMYGEINHRQLKKIC